LAAVSLHIFARLFEIAPTGTSRPGSALKMAGIGEEKIKIPSTQKSQQF
jgi:hypothetical protein